MSLVNYRRCSPLLLILPRSSTKHRNDWQFGVTVIFNFPFSKRARLFRAKSFFPAARSIHRCPSINEIKFITLPYVTVLLPNKHFLLQPLNASGSEDRSPKPLSLARFAWFLEKLVVKSSLSYVSCNDRKRRLLLELGHLAGIHTLLIKLF